MPFCYHDSRYILGIQRYILDKIGQKVGQINNMLVYHFKISMVQALMQNK